MRLRILSFILIFLLLFSGCGSAVTPPEPPTETTTSTEPPLSAEELEILRVTDAVKAYQTENSFSFLAFADTHFYGQNDSAAFELAGMAAAQIRKNVALDFSVLLGGITADASQFQSEALQDEVVGGYFKEAISGIPLFTAIGEQDRYPVSSMNSPSESYFFHDLSQHKTRIIILNTSDTASGNNEGMSATQLQWFAQSLDLSEKADAEDWGILILSHMPLDFGSLLNSAGRILDAYLTGSDVELTIQEETISYSFAEKNAAEIIANIHGHTHNFLADNLYLTMEKDGMYRSAIVRICIPNLNSEDTNQFSTEGTTGTNGIAYGEAETYDKIPGTEKSISFNTVTVDRDKKIISCINYGAGFDREIPYRSGLLTETLVSGMPAPEGSYVNQIPESKEFGIRNNTIFNGIGYRNNTYLVCNDIKEEAWPYGNDARYVTTGAIPFTVPSYLTPPVIYIWGAELNEDEQTRFFIYDSQKYRLVLQATGAEFKNYFTIEQLGDLYYKLTPIPEGKASVLFPATNGRAGRGSIAFSLKGTGENLVITVGEPILPES